MKVRGLSVVVALAIFSFVLVLGVSACGGDETAGEGEGEGEGEDGDVAEDGDMDEDGARSDNELQVVVDGDKGDIDGDMSEDDMAEDAEESEDISDGDMDVEDEQEPVETQPGYRMNSLILVDPVLVVNLGEQYDLTAMLNEQIVDQIAQEQLNMLMLPNASDYLDFPYEMVLSAGEAQQSYYVADIENSYRVNVFQHTENDHRFVSPEELEIALPIGNQPDMELTIKNATLRGTYSGDFSIIDFGALAGVVTEEDAQNFVIYQYGAQVITLKTAFDWLQVFPDPAIGGYRIEFSYAAYKVEVL